MNNKRKKLNLLGLAMRAQKLESGQANVVQSIRSKQAKLVLIASDASENTKKTLKDKSESYQINYLIVFSKEEMSLAIGKNRSACALLDEGFARSFMKL